MVFRFIETDPETVLETSDLVATRFEADLGPTTPAAAKLWRGHDVRIHGVRDGALEIEQDGNDPWLAIDTPLDADAIVAVEVELTNPGPAEVQLFWAGRWQRFSMNLHLELFILSDIQVDVLINCFCISIISAISLLFSSSSACLSLMSTLQKSLAASATQKLSASLQLNRRRTLNSVVANIPLCGQ